jgi:hypothetical protein
MAISITPSPFGSVTITLDGELGGVLQASILATSNSALNMDLGVPGPQGEAGEPGANGVGVAAGGTTGQALVKLSGTNYDTGWATISGGSGTWGSITGTLSNQTDLYSALNGKLSLTGGIMSSGALIDFSADVDSNTSVLGAWGLGIDNANAGETAYIQANQIRTYNGDYVNGTSLTPNGINFNDESTQTTAYNPSVLNGYLPLTGGTVSGSVTIDGGNNFTVTGGDGDLLKVDYNTNIVKIGLSPTPVEISYDWIKVENSDGHMLFGRNYEGADNLGIRFANNTFQNTAWIGYNGTTSQYIRGDGSLYTFPPVGDRYLTSSTSTLTVDSGNGKTMTVGTGLSYSRQQDITVSYDTANHMHGTVLTYNSTTGVMTFDSNTHSGGGTYSSWEVNVGGVAGAILPVGGTAGQVLAKINSTNFNTEWISLGSMAQATTTDYLSKAGNLAGIASTTTARTNLGLGTASTLASSAVAQTANNLSDLASASTARTNLGLGTAATQTTATFLQTANNLSDVTASTARTNLGLTSLATASYSTTSEAQAGTSTTAVINPSTLLDAKFFAGYKPLSLIYTWTSATSGTGAFTTVSGLVKIVSAPTSLTGYAQAIILNNNASRGQQYTSGADFTKRTTIGGRFVKTVTTVDANSIFRFLLGKITPSTPAGDLSVRGIGFRQVANGALELQVHNGTSLFNVTSSFTPTVNQTYDVVIVADSGTATMFVNGSSVATSANAPTALLGANTGVLEIEAQNTSTLSGSAMQYVASDMFVQTNL